MEKRELTPQESLNLISETIRQSRREYEKNSGTPMTISGIVVCAVATAVYFLIEYTGNPMWNFLWFACLVIFPITGWNGKKHKTEHGKSLIGTVCGYIWMSYGIMISCIAALCIVTETTEMITICSIVMLGLCCAITGLVTKNNPVTVCGFVSGLVGTVLCKWTDGATYALLIGLTSVFTLLIPGILMNIRSKKN